MIILDNTKSLSVLANDTTNGLGQLNVLTAFCDEELNGIYEVELTVSTKEKYFNLLSVGSILKIKLDAIRGEQMFRVYFISKPINEIATIKLQHISYDCSKISVAPFESTGAVASVNGLLSHIIGTYPFTLTTNIENTSSNFKLDIPRSFRECLGGYEGSLLDTFRGEYEWDNLTIRMLARRGSDNGVRIAYGKNLTDFNQEENNENTYDGVLGYAVVDEVTYTANTYYNKTGATNPRILNVDFSSDYESGEVPTPSDLLAKATTYATNNNIEVPNVNITISFVPLWQTEEYKNIAPLERVNLGDTVHVFFDKLNVEASSRVVKTRWNIVSEKYDEIELGSTKANLNTVLNETSEETKKDILSNLDVDTGYIVEELEGLANLITNGLGLFVTKDVLIDGSMRIVLHNKPTVEETIRDGGVMYYIGANGLVVSTDGGSTWNAGFNPDGSAYFNALSANIIRALQIYGSFLRFGDESSNYIDVAPYSINNVPQGVSFDGTGAIRMRPAGQFNIQNYKNDTIYNQLLMTQDDTAGNQFYVANNNNNGNVANFLRLGAQREYNSSIGLANYIALQNYCYDDVSYVGNYISFYSTSADNTSFPSRNVTLMTNRKYESINNANYVSMTGTPTATNLAIYNQEYSSDSTGSYISMTSNSTSNAVNIYNSNPLRTAQRNNISMTCTKSTEYSGISLTNVCSSNVNWHSNDFFMSGYPNSSTMQLTNYMAGQSASIPANQILMSYSSGGARNLTLSNYDASGTSYFASNEIKLSSTDGISITANRDDIKIRAGVGDIYIQGYKIKFNNHYIMYE